MNSFQKASLENNEDDEKNSTDQLRLKEKLPGSPEKNSPISTLYSINICPETKESSSELNSELNKSTINESNYQNDKSILGTLEETMPKGDDGNEKMLLEANDDDDLELRYEDDGDEKMNEDSEDKKELEDNIIKILEDSTSVALQNQDDIHVESEKNEDCIDHQIDNVKNKAELEKHKSNERLLNEENLNTYNELKDDFAIIENKTASAISDTKNISSITQHGDVSFDRIAGHGLNKPDMMLEIPTQEFIEFSDEDDEDLVSGSYKMSPDIEDVIDLEENDIEYLGEMNESKFDHIEDKVRSSTDMDIAIVADPAGNAYVSQEMVEGSKNANMDITQIVQIDTTTNALSNEAEIAADIITKEMNGMADETTCIKDTEDTQAAKEIEEMIIPLETELGKEITSQFILDDTEVIELSDDNTENEPEHAETLVKPLADQNAKIESAIKMAELEEDIINHTEEIDNIILSVSITKTRITDFNVNESEFNTKNICILGFSTGTNSNPGSESDTEYDEIFGEETFDDTIAIQNIAHDPLTDELSFAGDRSTESVERFESMHATEASQQDMTSNSIYNVNMSALILPANSVINVEPNSASEYEPQISETPQALKSTCEHYVSMLKDSDSLTNSTFAVNSVPTELYEYNKKTKTNHTKDRLKSPKTNTSTAEDLPVISEKGILKKPDFKNADKPMEIDNKQHSMSIEVELSEPIKPQPSTSKIESNISEIVEQEESKPMVETIIEEILKAQLTSLNIETITSEIAELQSSISNMEPIPAKTSLKTETKTNIVEPQPSTSKFETMLLSVKPDPQPSTSKIEPQILEPIEPQPSTSKIRNLSAMTLSNSDTNSDIIIAQPSTSQIETIKSKIADPQPSTTKIAPQISEKVEPKPSTSKCDSGSFNSKPNSLKNQLAFESLVQDSSDDIPEMTDSLGLLAESSRVMEDDEEHDDEEYGDGEDEDDFEPDDESSNQMTAEHSEDSNAHHSESDVQKDPETPSAETQEIPFKVKKVIRDMEKIPEKIEKAKKTEKEAVDDESMKISDASDAEGTERKNERSVEKALSSLLDDKKQTTSATKQSRADLTTEDTSSDVPHAMTEITKSPVLVKDEVKPDEAVTVKTKSPTKAEAPTSHSSETKARSPIGLEVFNLDSDEEDSNMKPITEIEAVKEAPEKLRKLLKCINRSCTNNDPNIAFYIPDRRTVHYFDADKKKHAYVCEKCADIVEKRNQDLIDGIRNFTPLFQLHTTRISEELVEISDSDSDEEVESGPVQLQLVGAEGAEMLTEKLADMINETWEKFQMDTRIEESRKELLEEMDRLQKESKDLDTIFNECQTATDKLRNSLYATFDPLIQEQPAIVIFDTPNCSNTGMEHTIGRRLNKRRLSPSRETSETPTKKSVSSLTASVASESSIGYSEHKRTLEQDASTAPFVEKCDDDNMDISVVQLSVEVAPADLPPPGDLSHPPIRLGMTVYAMKNAFGTWLRAKVVEIQPKAHNIPFTMVRVRFEHKVSKNPFKTLPARCLAYFEPSEVRMTIGTRVIALFKDISLRQAYYSGIVAEIPNPVNNYRYLIFFDDGYAQYATHSQTRLVCEFSSLVWEEVHPYSREFVRSYLLAYPERPMVRLHAGQNLKTEWRGKWWSSRVINVDASLVEVQFLRCDRREWIYRGSTRLAPLYLELQAAERHRPRALPRTQPQVRVNMPYVEYTRSDEQANKQPQTQRQQQNEEIRRQRAVAKKSTAIAPQPPVAANNDDANDSTTSRVVYYTPKNAVKPLKMTPHTCSPKCKRTDVLALKELRTYNPLAKPLLSGWERQVVRGRGLKQVMYVAPCGRRLRNVRELHRYLRSTDCDMPVDLFDFSPTTHCLAEYVLNKCFVGKKDLSHGKEIVPVPCVNCVDDSLPEFCSYNTERTPTAGVPLNLDPEFLCGCDCEDDCEDKAKCACWKMTLEGARTIGYEGDVGYDYRRLPEPLPSGIYECNSRCKCKNTCLNRVAQHPLQLKLQVFKTDKRGWGIRALNDVPKGAFLCVYAGNLLTDATANLDGLNEGDEYLAELDYIEVVEQMKEGFEEDIPDKIKAKDKKELARKKAEEEDEEDEESSEEENTTKRSEQEDDDFVPGIPGLGLGVAAFSKRLRRRDSRKEEDTKPPVKEKEADEDCITISDDEEVREPSCFTAAAGMGNNQFISKYRSVRTLFGEDEACYIVDAKVQGNIGRYLNHSCTPNVFVQNVFVDTHDPRFPWVAFFALHHIRAGTELTWNYNYDVGSVPGKVLYCFCGAPNCRGRLL